MNRSAMLLTALTLALASPSMATAQESGAGGGTFLGGATLGSNRNTLAFEMGWPGLFVTVLHGQSERFDIGGSFGFVYGVEGVPKIAPGFKLNLVTRLNLFHEGHFNLGFKLSPGLTTYFPSDSVHYRFYVNDDSTNVMFGLSFPVEIVAGYALTHELTLSAGVAMPMTLFFTPEFSFVLPFQPGAGIEYRVDHALSLTFDMRFGPSVFMVPDRDPTTYFAFRLLVGLAYRY